MIALLIISLLLTLICFISVGIEIGYENEALSANLRISKFHISLYPKKAEGKKNKSEKPKKKSVFSIKEWLQIVKIVLKTLGRFNRSITVDHIKFHFISGDSDPYDAVVRYNTVNAAVFGIAPYCEQKFKIKKRDILIDTDLDSEKNTVEAVLVLSVRVWQIFWIVSLAGFSTFTVYIKHIVADRRERKAQNGKQQAQRSDAVYNEQHQKSC